jgi:hypothetical protein
MCRIWIMNVFAKWKRVSIISPGGVEINRRTMKRRGKHLVRVCLGTACHVGGKKRNLEHLMVVDEDTHKQVKEAKLGQILTVSHCLVGQGNGHCSIQPDLN